METKTVLIVGGAALVGFVVLLSARGGGSTLGATLQSQQTAANTDVALSSIAAQYHSTLATLAARDEEARMARDASVSLGAMSFAQNIAAQATTLSIASKQMMGGIVNNMIGARTALQLEGMRIDGALKLAPFQERVAITTAQIASDNAKAIASIQAQTSVTLAQLANARSDRAADSNDLSSGLGFLSDVAPIAASFFL